ncbi:hypothetical protein ACJX0J_036257, partial [Zea mays]
MCTLHLVCVELAFDNLNHMFGPISLLMNPRYMFDDEYTDFHVEPCTYHGFMGQFFCNLPMFMFHFVGSFFSGVRDTSDRISHYLYV